MCIQPAAVFCISPPPRSHFFASSRLRAASAFSFFASSPPPCLLRILFFASSPSPCCLRVLIFCGAAGRQEAVGCTEVHSCINIYNFRQQFRDRLVSWKCCLRTTIRRVEETVGFVIFSKCFVVFSKCCLRLPSGACRVAIRYEKTPEQARDNRRSAPMLCKDTTFFAEIQIARFCVNISRMAMEAPAIFFLRR